jgi:hypothetical protein
VAARRTSADVPADRASSVGARLRKANEVRSAKAALKKQLAAGTIGLAQILAARPPCYKPPDCAIS